MSNLNLQKLREWVWPWPWTFNLPADSADKRDELPCNETSCLCKILFFPSCICWSCLFTLQCVWGNSRQIATRWNSTSGSECSENSSWQLGFASPKQQGASVSAVLIF